MFTVTGYLREKIQTGISRRTGHIGQSLGKISSAEHPLSLAPESQTYYFPDISARNTY